MKVKVDLKPGDELGRGGQHVKCDNPNCPNAYHYIKDMSYSILNQDREDGLIIDLSFCSLKCLLEIEPIKEQFGVEVAVQ
ncbi:hypothetical protein ABE945_14220 [Enterococcus gilvus]|uniref:hypothetical protein n=1 Tax=Enterococcus gilvus TaxID=160453 RepID=UPI003D6AB720